MIELNHKRFNSIFFEVILMKISKGTIIRTVVLLLALTNQILTACGKNPLPFSSEETEQGISAVFTIFASLAAWWKNNSFTSEAIEADGYLAELREEKI